MIRPNTALPIQFMTNQNLGQKLIRIYDKQQLTNIRMTGFSPPAFLTAIINVELCCEIRGIERKIAEDCSVQVNLITAEFSGL